MTFILQNWAQSSTSANVYAPIVHTYISATDTVSQVSAANYFSAVAVSCNVGDQIYAVCSDATVTLQVTAINDSILPPFTISTSALPAAASSIIGVTAGVLTQAQWQGMYAAPVNLLPSFGANTTIIVDSLFLNYHFATAAFSGGGLIVLEYGNAINGAGPAACATLTNVGFSDQTSSRVVNVAGGIASTSVSATNGAGLFISNQTAAFAGGGAGSTIAYSLYYRTVTPT